MKILWLHQYYSTPKGWGAVRTYEFARRFCSMAHEVEVVCCAGYDSSLSVAAERGVMTVRGITVHVSRVGYRPHMGFVRRVYAFLLFMLSAGWHVLRFGARYDLVIASSGPLTLAIPALLGKWLWRLPFVFEVIDVWPDSAIAAGVLKNVALKRLSFWLEALAYRHASAIVTCSTGMTNRVERKLSAVQKRGVKRSARVVTVSNCSDLESFVPDAAERASVRACYGVGENQLVALYTGAMGLSNAIPDLDEAIRITAVDSRIVWWLVGDGSAAETLKARQSAQVRWFGVLPKQDVVGLYMAADVNLVTFLHEPLFFENSPNKFFDGIAAGLPAVFNRTTWLEPWIARYGCGVICLGEKPGEEIAQALRELAGDRDRLKRMAAGARRLAEESFNCDKLAAEYLAVLRDVQKCGSSNVRNDEARV